MRATYKERWVSIKTGSGETEINIKPGQFVFGRKAAAKELKVPPSTIRNRMDKLKNMGNLDIKTDTHFSIITICNWIKYQPDEKEKGQAEGQPGDNQGTGTGQPEDTNKKGNKGKKEKKETQSRFSARIFLLERNVKEQHADDWLKVRKEKKLKPTKTALESVVREAVKAKLSLPEAIEKCCVESWGGFKASWVLNDSSKRSQSDDRQIQKELALSGGNK
jgi:hypothetical protein